MIVCVCKAVSCSVVRREIAAGADSIEALGRACGAGTDCGGCRGHLEDMIEDGAVPSLSRRLPVLPGGPGTGANGFPESERAA